MIKLVASDLDSTLLHNYQQTVPKEIYDTIKALHEKGIIFTAASGRQPEKYSTFTNFFYSYLSDRT